MSDFMNFFKRLKIESDKYGTPIGNINDNTIKEAYYDRLQEFYIALRQEEIDTSNPYERNTELWKEKEKLIREQRIIKKHQTEEEIENKFEEIRADDLDTMINCLEVLIQSNYLMYKNSKNNKYYEFFKEAFYNLNSKFKRDVYIEQLNQETGKIWDDTLKEYSLPININTDKADNMTYGDLQAKSLKPSPLYVDNDIRIFIEEVYVCISAEQGEQMSEIKSKVKNLEPKEIMKYSIMVKNPTFPSKWETKEFYADRDIIKELQFEVYENEEHKKCIIKGIIDILGKSDKKQSQYIGKISCSDEKINCVIDEKMKTRINELIVRNEKKQESDKLKVCKFVEGSNR